MVLILSLLRSKSLVCFILIALNFNHIKYARFVKAFSHKFGISVSTFYLNPFCVYSQYPFTDFE